MWGGGGGGGEGGECFEPQGRRFKNFHCSYYYGLTEDFVLLIVIFDSVAKALICSY